VLHQTLYINESSVAVDHSNMETIGNIRRERRGATHREEGGMGWGEKERRKEGGRKKRNRRKRANVLVVTTTLFNT
jgi:hypothetical protein